MIAFLGISIKIKDRCGNEFHTVVYLYDYNPDAIVEKSKQDVFSRFLGELKMEYSDEIVLIPIAKNMDLVSLNILAGDLNVTETSIVVDEKLVVSDVEDLHKINEALV